MDFELQGKVALITGGSRGIGRAAALTMARHGANTVICGRDEASLASTVAELEALGVRALGVPCDVSDAKNIERLVEATKAFGGQVDVLINNAVTSTSARFDELTDEEFRYHIDVKLMAYIRLARQLLPSIAEQRGRIVNVGGMTARIVAPLRMTNGVVNAGVANFTKQFAGYAAEYGVTVNCVHPGYTLTERVMQMFESEAAESGDSLDAVIERKTREIPLGRLIDPQEVADAILFFCSPLSTSVTGQCIAVDGGSGEAINY